MEIVKLLLITLLAAVAGGCIIGILSGKRAVKKATSQRAPLLTRKERIVYLSLLLAGALCVAAGIFWIPSETGDYINPEGDGAMMEDAFPQVGDDYIKDPGADSGYDEDEEVTTDEANAGEGDAVIDDTTGTETPEGAADAAVDSSADAPADSQEKEAAAADTETAEASVGSTGGVRANPGGGTVVVRVP